MALVGEVAGEVTARCPVVGRLPRLLKGDGHRVVMSAARPVG
jgi:hypothetical protein